jgi:hypothetical protein
VERLVELRTEDLDPAKALEEAKCPILVLAGDSERVLRAVEIEYLYGCIRGPKQLALFEGAEHQDLLAYDPRRFSRAVGEFLNRYSGVQHSIPAVEFEPGDDNSEQLPAERAQPLSKAPSGDFEGQPM